MSSLKRKMKRNATEHRTFQAAKSIPNEELDSPFSEDELMRLIATFIYSNGKSTEDEISEFIHMCEAYAGIGELIKATAAGAPLGIKLTMRDGDIVFSSPDEKLRLHQLALNEKLKSLT